MRLELRLVLLDVVERRVADVLCDRAVFELVDHELLKVEKEGVVLLLRLQRYSMEGISRMSKGRKKKGEVG
jgi:hypothetical protein